MIRYLPVGKLKTLSLLGTLALITSACSSTSIPEGSDRIFGLSEEKNLNPFVPLITLNGENPVTLDVFSSYVDQGATAESIEDGVIPSQNILVAGFVNTQVVGTYEVIFSVADSLGRIGEAKRVVNVVDRVKPTISILTNQTEMRQRRGFGNLSAPDYNLSVDGLAGVQAIDQYDGDITANLDVQGPVLIDAEGDYPVIYNGVDSSGNAADPKIRIVQVRDTIAPGISIGNFSVGSISFSESAQITVQFEDAAQIYSPFDEKVEIISATGGAAPNCNLQVSANGMSRTVTVSNCAGSGQVKLRVLAGAAQDGTTIPAANQTAQADSSSILTIANATPVVMLGTPSDLLVRDNDGNTLIPVTYSIPVTGFLQSDEVESNIVSGNPNCNISIENSGSQNPSIKLQNCQGNGQIRFRVEADAVISQNGGIPNDISGYSQTITVDNIDPVVSIGTPSNPGPIANGTAVDFPVTYSESISGSTLTESEVTINASGVSCQKTVTNGATPTPTIQIFGCTGTGSFTIRVNFGAVQDLADNVNAQSANSATILVDNQGPTVTIGSPSNPGPINAGGSSSFSITYSEAVITSDPLTAAEISLTPAGGQGCEVQVNGGNTQTPSVVLSGCEGNGNVQIRVNAAAVKDALNNTNPQSNLSSPVLIDNGGLNVSIGTANFNPALQGGFMNGSSGANFPVTYSEPISGSSVLADNEVTVTLGGTATCATSILNGNSQTPTIRAQGCSGEGTYQVRVNANVVEDAAGNPNANPSNLSAVLNVDALGPRVTLGSPTNVLVNGGSNTSAVIITFTDSNLSSVNLQSFEVNLQTSGGANANKAVSCGVSAGLPANQCRVTLSSFTGNGTINIVVPAGVESDLAFNPNSASSPSLTITVDTAAPQIRFATGTNPWNLPLCSVATNFLTDGIEICEPGVGACVPVTGAVLAVLSNDVNRLDSTQSYQVNFKATDLAGNEGFNSRTVNVNGSLNGTTYEYGISSAEDLLGTASKIRDTVQSNENGDFLLCNSIDFDGFAASRPIGHPVGGGPVRGLKGIFEGQNYELVGIQISNTSSNTRSGLFAQLEDNGGLIRNLKLRDLSVTSNTDETGGLVGRSLGDVKKVAIVGQSMIVGSNRVGGLVGRNNSSGDVDESFSEAKVMAASASSNVGGLVGLNEGGEIRDSFVVPSAMEENITGLNLTNVGGLVGRSDNGSVERSYAVGWGLCALSGVTNVGGLVGLLENGAEVLESFWDKQVAMNSPTSPLCDEGVAYGNAKTSAEMMTPSTYPTSWLASIWRIQVNEYPDLIWSPLF